MYEEQQHEMILEESYPSGAQEWYCPVCERRLLIMNWHPAGKQIIINLGDEGAHTHTRQKGFPEVSTSRVPALSAEEKNRLAVWIAWLEEVDFDSWWDSPLV